MPLILFDWDVSYEGRKERGEKMQKCGSKIQIAESLTSS